MKNPPKTSGKLAALVFSLQTKVVHLETENQFLRKENQQLKQENQKLQLQLLKKKSNPPFHPKANTEPEEKDKQPRNVRRSPPDSSPSPYQKAFRPDPPSFPPFPRLTCPDWLSVNPGSELI